MDRLHALIEGVGLLGPGLENWTAAVPVLNGTSAYVSAPTVLPVPEGLPPAERRRLGRVVKLALGAGMQAISAARTDAAALPAVFASSGGDGQNCHEICEALSQEERLISPTRFHNSVHNAAAGYWGIATRSTAPSNVVSAFDASFAAGLLEAITQVVVDQTRILLEAYDAPYPEPLFTKRPIPEAFGVALVLAPIAHVPESELAPSAGTARGPQVVAGVRNAVGRLAVSFSDAPPDRMSAADFEALRATIPAARSLPLLRQLAVGRQAVVNIEYLDGRSLAVEIEPCT